MTSSNRRIRGALTLQRFMLMDKSNKRPPKNTSTPSSIVLASGGLRDHLMSSLRSMAEVPKDVRIAEYLVNSLDERGWLKIDETDAIEVLDVTKEDLMRGIAHLQSCDPPGIGARSLQESVQIQLRSLDEDGAGNALLAIIVDKYWDELVQHKYPQIARHLRRPIDEVEAAVRFLQTEISPDPASQFREPWDYKPDGKSIAVRPDVIIKRTSTGFDVEVLGLDLPVLNVNVRYRTLYELLRNHDADTCRLPGRPNVPELWRISICTSGSTSCNTSSARTCS